MIVYDNQGLQLLLKEHNIDPQVIKNILVDCENQTERLPNQQQYYFYNDKLYANYITQAEYCILHPIFSVPVKDLLQISLCNYFQSNINQLISMMSSTQQYIFLDQVQELIKEQFVQYMSAVSELIQNHSENPRGLCFDDIQIVNQQIDISGAAITSIEDSLDLLQQLGQIYTITSLNVSNTYLTYTQIDQLLKIFKDVRTVYCYNVILDDIYTFIDIKHKYMLVYYNDQNKQDEQAIQPYIYIDDLPNINHCSSQNLFGDILTNEHLDLLQKHQNKIYKIFCNKIDDNINIEQLNQLSLCCELNFMSINHNLININEHTMNEIKDSAAKHMVDYCLQQGIIFQQQEYNIFNIYPTFLVNLMETLTFTQQDHKANYIVAAYQHSDNISLIYIPLYEIRNSVVRGYPVYKYQDNKCQNLLFMFKYNKKIEKQYIEQLLRSQSNEQNGQLFQQIIINNTTSPNYVFTSSFGDIALLLYYYQYIYQQKDRIVYNLTSNFQPIENQSFCIQLLTSGNCEYIISFSCQHVYKECKISLIHVQNAKIENQQNFMIHSDAGHLEAMHEDISQEAAIKVISQHQNGIFLVHPEGYVVLQ